MHSPVRGDLFIERRSKNPVEARKATCVGRSYGAWLRSGTCGYRHAAPNGARSYFVDIPPSAFRTLHFAFSGKHPKHLNRFKHLFLFD